jgi:hypothetical protein
LKLTKSASKSESGAAYKRRKEKHLHRYLEEFWLPPQCPRCVNDEQRAAKMVKGAKGKGLTYRAAGSARSEA